MGAAATALFIAVFLACVVEAVEATTISPGGRHRPGLALGRHRHGGARWPCWRSSSPCSARPSRSIPLRGLRVVVGALLLVFGLQWLRKAILRASGHKALHDEDKSYAEHLAEAPRPAGPRRSLRSCPTGTASRWPSRACCSKGLEVVFIVLTFGANATNVGAGRHRRWLRCGARGGGRLRDQGAAGQGAGEHDEVRRRDHADQLRRCSGAPRARARTGPARTRRCW